MLVNSGLLEGVSMSCEVVHDREMTLDGLREVLRKWLEDLVAEKTNGNESQFARETGIAEEDVNRAINRKGRHVTLGWLVKISRAQGYPAIDGILTDVAERCALANTRETQKTQREKLRARLASGELQARASSAARARQQDEQPEHPKPPEATRGSKTGDQD